MRPPLLCALLLWTCAAAFSPTSSGAESEDPSNAFVDAWMLVQQAERTQLAGNLNQALPKFQEAAAMLDKISKDYPAWSPMIVKYRKERTAAAIARLEEKLRFYGPPELPKVPPRASSDTDHEYAGESNQAFVEAWMLVIEAEKAEAAGDLTQALEKFREVARKMDKISREHPKWNPSILKFRKDRTAAAIERVQWKLKHPQSSVPARLQEGGVENPLPDGPAPAPVQESKDLGNGIFLIQDRAR